jgi:hypothetical protein
MNLQLEPADIFLTRRRGFGSWAIRFFTRHIGKSRTEVSHVGVVVEGGSLEKTWMVEARGRVRHRLLFRHYGRKTKIDVAIFRPLHLTPVCSWLVAQAYAKAGETFGVPPGAASPDDIWDYVTAHPKKYLMLHPLAPLVPPKQ